MTTDNIAIGFTILTSIMVTYFLYREFITSYKLHNKKS